MLTITLYHLTEDPNKGKIDSTSLLQELVFDFENNSIFEVSATDSNFNYRKNIMKKNCWKYLTARKAKIVKERRPECLAEHLPVTEIKIDLRNGIIWCLTAKTG